MKDGSLDFSFSGLKSAVRRHVQARGLQQASATASGDEVSREVRDLVASFQRAVVVALLQRLRQEALRSRPRSLLLTGGVAANSLPLNREAVRGIDRAGGTILHTSRTDPRKEKAGDRTAHVLQVLERLGIDAMITLGGDGTLRFSAHLAGLGVKIISIPSESCIINNLETYIQISIWATINARATMSIYLYFLSVFNTGRNSYANTFIVNRQYLLLSFVNISKIQV